ncbi:MAG: SH3 domain-containing protein [Candidatus Entotheonellia bacterium]
MELWVAKMRCFIRRFAAQRAYAYLRRWIDAMLIALMVAVLPWQVAAETIIAPLSNTSEQATESPRRGVVTLNSNLRASPSMQSEIVAIAKDGTHVEILLETERWYRVRSEAGVEAWIYKPLVLIEHEPLKDLGVTPVALTRPDIAEVLFASAAKPDASIESGLTSTLEQQGSGASSPTPLDEPHLPREMTEAGWFIDVMLSHIQSLGASVIIALVIVLVLSIALQLRATRQLRRATQEMGQILDIMEGIYADGASTRANDSGAAWLPIPADASAHQPPRPLIEFSPIEHAVLEALSDQHVVQEGELGKILEEKGFAGVLIKAIIGDIVRKTGTAGLPWVEVRYTQGWYSYRLRPEAVPTLSEQPSERR